MRRPLPRGVPHAIDHRHGTLATEVCLECCAGGRRRPTVDMNSILVGGSHESNMGRGGNPGVNHINDSL